MILLLLTKDKGKHHVLKRLYRSFKYTGEIKVAVMENRFKKGVAKNSFDDPLAVVDAITHLMKVYKPKAVLITDSAVTKVLFGVDVDNSVTRGSVFYYKNIPFVSTLDQNSLNWTNAQSSNLGVGGARTASTVEERQYYIASDINKSILASRNQHLSPEHKGKICETVQDVVDILAYAKESDVCAIDIETSNTITAIAFTYLWNCKGVYKIRSFCVPFVNPTKKDYAQWATLDDENLVWAVVRKLCMDHNIKVMHNGSYDMNWLMLYKVPINNYYIDTYHLHRSYNTLLSHKLATVSSLYVGDYKYWKDEIKGGAVDEKGTKLPKTISGLRMFHKYNMKDTYNTLLCFLNMAPVVMDKKWVLTNYVNEMNLQFKVGFTISNYGMHKDKELLYEYMDKVAKEEAQQRIRAGVVFSKPDFNNRNADMRELVYNGFMKLFPEVKPPRKYNLDSASRLYLYEEVPVLRPYLDLYNDWRKNSKVISDFSKYMQCKKSKIYSTIGTRTWTGRFSSTGHNLRILGSGNVQNINKKQKVFFCARPKHWLVEIDYSQSDNYFVAHACEDAEMMKVVNDKSIDTHLYHAAFFFKIPYEELYKRYKSGDPDAAFMRKSTKPITHGAHYGMGGSTLIGNIGATTASKIANRLGMKGDKMTRQQLGDMLAVLMDEYKNKLYPGLVEWMNNLPSDCVRRGNIQTCYGGRTVLFQGSIETSDSIKRALASFHGQGGTGGNVNRALLALMNNKKLLSEGMRLVNTVHDSIVLELPYGKLNLIEEIVEIMERPCELKGRTFVVPTDVSVGISWADLDDYDPNVPEETLWRKKQQAKSLFFA